MSLDIRSNDNAKNVVWEENYRFHWFHISPDGSLCHCPYLLVAEFAVIVSAQLWL